MHYAVICTWSVEVKSIRLFLHLAAACLFLSRLNDLLPSSSGVHSLIVGLLPPVFLPPIRGLTERSGGLLCWLRLGLICCLYIGGLVIWGKGRLFCCCSTFITMLVFTGLSLGGGMALGWFTGEHATAFNNLSIISIFLLSSPAPLRLNCPN